MFIVFFHFLRKHIEKNVNKNVHKTLQYVKNILGCHLQAFWGPGLDAHVAPQVHSSKGWGACLGPACLAGGPQWAKYGGHGCNRNKNAKKRFFC